MRIPSKVQRLLVNALSQSMSVHTMVRVAKMVDPDYDLYERTGFPQNIPIPSIDAARQIILDVIAQGLVIDFVANLVEIHEKGIMGTKTNVRFLSQIIKELETIGFHYNMQDGSFVETNDGTKTRNWGVLIKDKVYDLTFISIDIVGNTELVRKYDQAVITRVYADLRDIFTHNVERHNGRVWMWEGDGGMAAFYVEDKNVKAVLAGIEIVLDLFFYNLFRSPLKEPIKMKIAVHTGPCPYTEQMNSLQCDTISVLHLLSEEFTAPDSLSITPSVYSDMGSKLELFFKPVTLKTGKFIYRYRLEWED